MLLRCLRITGLTVAIILATTSPFANAQMVSYDISVTIPAIPGFNVPPFEDPVALSAATPHSEWDLDFDEESILREGQPFILRTYVAR